MSADSPEGAAGVTPPEMTPDISYTPLGIEKSLELLVNVSVSVLVLSVLLSGWTTRVLAVNCCATDRRDDVELWKLITICNSCFLCAIFGTLQRQNNTIFVQTAEYHLRLAV